jgi:hypothetical protein
MEHLDNWDLVEYNDVSSYEESLGRHDPTEGLDHCGEEAWFYGVVRDFNELIANREAVGDIIELLDTDVQDRIKTFFLKKN